MSEPYFAPNCRRGPHWLTTHHDRFSAVVGKECECPCHQVGTLDPWWSEVNDSHSKAQGPPQATNH